MKEIDYESDPLYLLTKAVEQGDPKVAKKVKDLLDLSLIHISEPTRPY